MMKFNFIERLWGKNSPNRQIIPKVTLLSIFAFLLFTVTPLSFPFFGSLERIVFAKERSSSSLSSSSSSSSILFNNNEQNNNAAHSILLPSSRNCDIFRGEWVPNPKAPYYTNTSCWAIHEHQNCMKYGRPDTEFIKWRWKPNDCELPIFNPFQFLEIMRNKSMAFVGDSVGRNQMQSLVCLLSRGAVGLGEKKTKSTFRSDPLSFKPQAAVPLPHLLSLCRFATATQPTLPLTLSVSGRPQSLLTSRRRLSKFELTPSHAETRYAETRRHDADANMELQVNPSPTPTRPSCAESPTRPDLVIRSSSPSSALSSHGIDGNNRSTVSVLLSCLSTLGGGLALSHSKYQAEWPVDDSETQDDYFRRWNYPNYNFTVAAFWTTHLVKSKAERNPNGLLHVYVDEADGKWSKKVEHFDYIVINGGHWFDKPMVFYEEQKIIGCYNCFISNITRTSRFLGYRKALKTALKTVNSLENFKGMTILRSYAPSHFENGLWNEGGDCVRRKPFKRSEVKLEGEDLELYRIQMEEIRVAEEEAKKKKKKKFRVLDVTQAMLMRPDGHPSKYGHWPNENVTLYNDCVHWCLPGPIDAWSDLLLEMLKMEGGN